MHTAPTIHCLFQRLPLRQRGAHRFWKYCHRLLDWGFVFTWIVNVPSRFERYRGCNTAAVAYRSPPVKNITRNHHSHSSLTIFVMTLTCKENYPRKMAEHLALDDSSSLSKLALPRHHAWNVLAEPSVEQERIVTCRIAHNMRLRSAWWDMATTRRGVEGE